MDGAEGLCPAPEFRTAFGKAVCCLDGIVDLYAGAFLDAVSEELFYVHEYLGLYDQNDLVEAGGKRVIDGVFHQYLAVRTEVLDLLYAAVA